MAGGSRPPQANVVTNANATIEDWMDPRTFMGCDHRIASRAVGDCPHLTEIDDVDNGVERMPIGAMLTGGGNLLAIESSGNDPIGCGEKPLRRHHDRLHAIECRATRRRRSCSYAPSAVALSFGLLCRRHSARRLSPTRLRYGL